MINCVLVGKVAKVLFKGEASNGKSAYWGARVESTDYDFVKKESRSTHVTVKAFGKTAERMMVVEEGALLGIRSSQIQAEKPYENNKKEMTSSFAFIVDDFSLLNVGDGGGSAPAPRASDAAVRGRGPSNRRAPVSEPEVGEDPFVEEEEEHDEFDKYLK